MSPAHKFLIKRNYCDIRPIPFRLHGSAKIIAASKSSYAPAQGLSQNKHNNNNQQNRTNTNEDK
jgi:hypothetical protein